MDIWYIVVTDDTAKVAGANVSVGGQMRRRSPVCFETPGPTKSRISLGAVSPFHAK